MTSVDQRIIDLTFRAIRLPEEWESVLQYIIKTTPAKAAIITLRDGKTCQIVDDNALVQQHHSPLIVGFSPEGVHYYLKELRTIDPWAAAQKKYYPRRPLLMSKVCHPESVGDQKFFKWLKSQGIQDTIAFELQSMPGYWTACNLFLEDYNPSQADELLDFANTHQNILSNAWQASQALIRSNQSEQAILDQLSNLGLPACLTGPNGEVFSNNSEFDQLIKLGLVRVVGHKRMLSIGSNVIQHGFQEWISKFTLKHDFDGPEFDVSAQAFEPDPLYKGNRKQFCVLTFRNRSTTNNNNVCLPFNLDQLTVQEHRLYNAILSGLSVSDAGVSIKLRRSRTYEVWSEVKHKP